MTLESGIALALATFVFACIPGPGISAVVAQSLARGFKAGASFTCGLALGDVGYLLTALFGMGWVASQIGPYFVVLKWAGAAYLVYMGVNCWLAKPSASQGDACPMAVRPGRSFLTGLCVTMGNPKAIAFYCGFLPGFVNMRELTGSDIILVISIIVPIIATVPLVYAWLASRGRNAIRSTRLWKVMNRTAGTIMIGAGAVIASE
ncbi:MULTISPECIES: LysE family translocator [unclassified Pseudodesulfovibrio]|uniref:LysE family translocator n=1 Tax=unclassified Pseudodesulfovibrio TaxID=2661612 RepID=UPI000FEBE9A9|nr:MULTISPECIES: LysE family translocator [unclassified Pseudodesulfovibrio]MCJ2164482.1 LysE family translocator [Pseudodesulfovibrio sp. S3-i]RWU04682.1 LysE family translocator [Pseudodesulfovibrio sp. S3]